MAFKCFVYGKILVCEMNEPTCVWLQCITSSQGCINYKLLARHLTP